MSDPIQLWHASDHHDITRFEPRLPSNADAGVSDPVVWAVADSHLVNYLLPRDCPRIAIRRGPQTRDADTDRFFGPGSPEVVLFIEATWFVAAHRPLWLYALPADGFVCADANAGYWVSRVAVVPQAVVEVAAPLEALLARGVELRVVPRLRPVAAAVAESTLSFSIIRLRNAAR